MKILIVEDQRRMGRFVEKALAEQNYVARLAGFYELIPGQAGQPVRE